jgi:hypothetical protein
MLRPARKPPICLLANEMANKTRPEEVVIQRDPVSNSRDRRGTVFFQGDDSHINAPAQRCSGRPVD